jgi:hypothetical protein
MVWKSLIVTLLSFAIYFIPSFFIWYYKSGYETAPSSNLASVFYFFFYSLPVIPITFLVLLTSNLMFAHYNNKWNATQDKKLYFLLTGGGALLITLGFTFSDYPQVDRFGNLVSFLDVLKKKSGIFIFILLVFVVNYRICFDKLIKRPS